MISKSRLMIVVLLTLAAGLLAAESALAIPAFARKYNFSCTTCHAPFPRLKEYGEEFAGNGFRLPEGEEPKRAYRDTGDDLLTLQRDLPLAVRLDAYATFEHSSSRADRVDMKTPWGLKLLSGGSVAPNVGYYFYFYMSERGEVAGVEDAYLHFNDLGGRSLDVMVGQFQISDPMMKRELRLSFEDYQAYKVKVGDSRANLTYDRGIMVTYDTSFGLGLVAEVVNGNGKGEADATRTYDVDTGKGYAGRATYALGRVQVGGFAYTTEEGLDGAEPNKVEVYGPDLVMDFGDKLSFTGQFLLRKDSDPTPSDPVRAGDSVDTDAAVAEFVFQPEGADGKTALVALYNWVDSDLDAHDYETWTLSVSRLYRRNLRMIAEATYDAITEDTRVVVGFHSAF